jgi:DNA processing protein
MNSVATKSVEGLLTLTGLRGIGPATAERLAERFPVLEAITDAGAPLKHVVSAAIAEMLGQRREVANARAKALKTLERAAQHGVRILSVFDDDYPNALRSLTDRPPLLFIKGTLPPQRSVACIGTREPSEFGEIVSNRIVETLVSADWAIVSGLAIGVDTLSHQAALRAGGRTIAVMAGGLDSIYPKQNALLADEILERDGALVSEQALGVPPTPRNLVQRDRLQSGLSVATFVMQTDIKGGSMHTVRYTLQQNRLLFAPVPHGRHALEPKSQGILALTRLTGLQFADAVNADGDYRRLLLERFRSRPPAYPLASREDYALMLEQLDAALASSPQSDPSAKGDRGNQLSML